MGRLTVRVAIVMTVLAASVVPVARASAASVPCTKLSYGRYECSFYPPGDGISAGAPVQNATGRIVGYLNQGRNWIVCQASGATVHHRGYYNRWWGYTEANDQHMGWVNAVYARGGSNNGPFAAIVPNCGSTYGSPPTSTTRSPSPHRHRQRHRRPSKVPCRAIGHRRHRCFFYPAGDGIHNGTPVVAGSRRVGYLNHGNNWVLCQQRGARKRIAHGIVNVWWAWTEANNHRMGWVNAVYARGGTNNGRFRGVPGCRGAHGTPPGVRKRKPRAPKPRRHPPRPSSCSATRENQLASVRWRFYERQYQVYQGQPEGLPPRIVELQKPSYHRFGSATIGAATCRSPKGWRVLSPLQVRTSSVGFYRDSNKRPVLSGTGSVRGWGVAVERIHNGVMDVHGIACTQGQLWSDVRRLGGFPLPVPYIVSLLQWGTDNFVPLPADKVKCGDLGTDRLHITANRHGRLRVTAPRGGLAMNGIFQSVDQSAGGQSVELVHTRAVQPPIITRRR